MSDITPADVRAAQRGYNEALADVNAGVPLLDIGGLEAYVRANSTSFPLLMNIMDGKR